MLGKRKIIFHFIIACASYSCASNGNFAISSKSNIDSSSSEKGINSLPEWIQVRPKDEAQFYLLIGESHGQKNIQEALQEAYINALVTFGIEMFPELISVQGNSIETQNSIEFRQQSFSKLSDINWAGLSEDSSKGSPVVIRQGNDKVDIYRIFRFPKDAFIKQKTQLKAS